MLSTRSGAVVKGIRHIESKRVRLDGRRPAIRAAKLGKPTPGLASLKPWMEIARRWNLSEREKRGSFEVAITILLHASLFLFNDLAFPLIRPPFLRRCFRFPPPLPSIFLMDGHLTKTRGGKKGQIRPMIRFCVSFQRHG